MYARFTAAEIATLTRAAELTGQPLGLSGLPGAGLALYVPLSAAEALALRDQINRALLWATAAETPALCALASDLARYAATAPRYEVRRMPAA